MDDHPERGGRPAGGERARYDRDLYSWAVEQAALLRAGRIGEADVLNIAEEIDDVGKQEYYRLESALRVILIHLLKWDYQRKRRSRSWRSTIAVQREHTREVLQDNPGLKPRISNAIERAYRKARIEAAGEMNRDEAGLPEDCPYSWDEIMERPISWPRAD
jgi:hypothetical protein